MDSSASVGVVFVLLHVITCLVLFLVSSVYADHSPALQSPAYCFAKNNTCIASVEYPLEAASWGNDDSCGYPGLEVDCNLQSGLTPFINISNHIYNVLQVDYKFKYIMFVDSDVQGSGVGCPQPKRNFSIPSFPSWVKYDMPGGNVTVFYNCSRVPADAEKHLLCSEEDTNTPPSYAFFDDESRAGFDWYRNCAQIVVVPVLVTSQNGANYSAAMKSGTWLGWSATGWCEDCERSGGQCWSNSTATGCACTNGNSYNTTCPPGAPPPSVPRHQEAPPPSVPRHQEEVPRTPSSNLKSQHHEDGLSTGLKIGIGILSGIGGILLVALLIFCKRSNHSSLSLSHWRNKKKNPINIEEFLEKYGCLALQRYKYSEIRKMTNSFKDTLGQGGYGRVFKGELPDGRLVAIKQLNESKGNGEDFINEVATIGRTNHVNVVNLVGFCIEGIHRALVYEFMPNGSLERFIYTQKESSTTSPLGWEKLYQIALGIARGLEYLHRGCNTRILHFDIKPHNILLDQKFCPKISDFGLAKLYPSRESVVSTVGARGTMGYIAPELYCRTFGNVSHKSDVYSYGMMMLEMIGGRKNIDATVDNISEIYFPLWVYNNLKQHYDAKGLEEIQTRDMFGDEKAKKMILVALWCIQAHPMDRPSMSKVVEMLEGNIHELQMPPNPSVDPRSSSSASL